MNEHITALKEQMVKEIADRQDMLRVLNQFQAGSSGNAPTAVEIKVPTRMRPKGLKRRGYVPSGKAGP